LYTIKEAALRAGVSIPLLRAWERRYGIVRPVRTPSGYRLYDEAAIDRVRAMRHLIDDGWSASQAARQIETEGIPIAAVAPAPAADTTGLAGAGADPDLTTDFVDAAAALDERRLERLLDDLFAGSRSFERIVDDRLMPALRALGEAWANGTVSVAGEHAASYAVVRRLSAAFDAAGGAARGRPMLVGLPPGSRHEIGSLAFATAARRRGIGVVYLGADVPGDSWIAALRATKARGIVIGIPTGSDHAPAAEVAVAALRLGGGLLVAVGGAGATDAMFPDAVIRLPDRIGPAAERLEDALAAVSG
jgi:DNA-binding transcriptional MerR regulator/methylmalonyl-CoA mutase cobalamin-binding subunit